MPPKKVASEKRKAEEQKEEETAEEPAKKEPKKDDKEGDPKASEPEPAKQEEEEKELEANAPEDSRRTLKDKIGFNAADTTLNLIPSMGDKLLAAISEGGLQYLIAGARANVGVKAGRYMFEVKILEVLNPPETNGGRSRPPMPRQLVRIGFSTAGSSTLLGSHDEHVCFDSEGAFFSGLTKTTVSKRLAREQVIAVVLNLDAKSPNHNTLSLFWDGARVSKPMPLPESLRGKTLFPHIAFRNVTLQVLMGPEASNPLPFTCRTMQGAVQADCVVAKPKEGPCEALFPVGLPDEGTFDWLDGFLKEHPDYVELSDRMIQDWAIKSGVWKPNKGQWRGSNDKPDFNFGLPSVDDGSIRRAVYNVAPLYARSYVVMEVRANLLATERAEYLKRFRAPHFKKVACVVMGEPPAAFKEVQHERMLKDKQAKAETAWREKVARRKIELLRAKQLADRKKKEEESPKDGAEKDGDAAMALEKAWKEKDTKDGKADGEEAAPMVVDETKGDAAGGGEEKKDEAPAGEGKSEEEKKEEEEKKDESMGADEEEEKEPPKVELSEEEKKVWFHPRTPRDLTDVVFSHSFANFTLPKKEEGFDAIRFEWQNDKQSAEYLKKCVLDRKKASRVEDLQPGQEFQEKWKEWQTKFSEFQEKQEKPKEVALEKKEGEEEEGKDDGVAAKDLYAIEDVCDVGNGDPLFKEWTFVDWVLLRLRYELFLLQAAFKKDVDDPERPGIIGTHLSFYYCKYFRKQLNPKNYGVEQTTELIPLVKDTVEWNGQDVLGSALAADTTIDMFVKITEEKRRQRQRRLDAGDETAKLAISTQALQVVAITSSGAGGGEARWRQPHWSKGGVAQAPGQAGGKGWNRRW